MEQDGFYLRVGLFVSALLVAAIMVISAFATGEHKDDYEVYGIYITGSVDGLGIGSPVRLKGITVGNVKAISFAQKEKDEILVLVNVLKGAPIHNDTVASVQMLGITGSSYISMIDTGNDPTPKVRKEGEEYPIIASTPSSFEKVFNNIPDMLEEVKKFSIRGQAFLSDDNIAAVNHTLKTIDSTAQSIESSAKKLEDILGARDSQSVASALLELNETLVEAKLTLREIHMLARTVREDPSVIIHGIQHEGKELPHE
jgi:phospholipid/cholesterol/gamma-HCH transport system substrate-binding protein